ncbi:MAG: hypothetical protein ACLFNM_01410 [Candidatus Woesearchaeota archaeon]
MKKIQWCKDKKEGIQKKVPNDNLANAYLHKAIRALKTSKEITDYEWKITSSYYATYFAIYSILIKIGIQCEIHSCTLAIAQKILYKEFSKEDIQLTQTLYLLRNKTQYYISTTKQIKEFEKIKKRIPQFISKSKHIQQQLTQKRKEEIIQELFEK